MNVKDHIKKAFDLIGAIPVTGDNVDIMCAARQELRTAYKALAAAEEVKAEEAADNG